MAELTLYGLKTCDICKKAIKALEGVGHSVTYIDVRADGVPSDILEGWLAEHGEALINTRSTTWRGLDEDQRLQAQTDPVTLLGLHPTLIKRPVIVNDGAVTVGWSKAVQAGFGVYMCLVPISVRLRSRGSRASLRAALRTGQRWGRGQLRVNRGLH